MQASPKGKIEHQSGADADAAVGDIEGGPVVPSQMNVNEIGYTAKAHAVKHISQSATENQPQSPDGRADARLPLPFIEKENWYGDEGSQAQCGQDTGMLGEQTESDAGIAPVNQVQQSGNQCNRLVW